MGNDPAILFADEPTGNLDSHNGEAIITMLLDELTGGLDVFSEWMHNTGIMLPA